jgi:hypothetical protein
VFDIYEETFGASEGSRAYIILAVIAFMALRAAPSFFTKVRNAPPTLGFLVGVRVGSASGGPCSEPSSSWRTCRGRRSVRCDDVSACLTAPVHGVAHA